MKSVAITDHGNLFGALDFYQKAKAHGVKPIFGCETYVAPDRLDKTERRSNHLILLAKNEVGWKNLSYLNSMGYLEGFYYNPRIDKPLLRAHSEGLVGLSACLGGEVAQTIMRRGVEAAETAAREFEDIFGKGNFFLEVQPNGLEEQETVNGHLIEMSKKTGIPLVATNDCHYLNQSDARAHEILMCVQQKKTIHDEKRLHHRNDAFFVKTPAEMEAYFKHIPQALENAAKLGALCNVEFKLGQTFLPKFQVPDGMTAESYLEEIAERRPEEAHRGGAPARREGRRRRLRRAPRARARRHQEDGLPRLLPDRLGLHPLRQGARHPRRARARLGRGLAGRVRDPHHRHRSDREQAAVRAVPEPRAGQHAGLRHRLLHEPARRGHRLRHRQVRQEQRRPDRHHAPDQGALRRPRHRPRDGSALRRGGQGGEVRPRADPGQDPARSPKRSRRSRG